MKGGGILNKLLEIEDLYVNIYASQGTVQAVRGVDMTLNSGEILAIVGESGCGKSVLCKSLMKLLPKNASIDRGSIIAGGRDITKYSEKEMNNLRGKFFSMIFQNPTTALNPTITVGSQLSSAIRIHNKGLSKKEAYDIAIELMKLVGIETPFEKYNLYPYQFSGGMCQRMVIAIALSGSPKLLIADEPTTALDVTIQAQILKLLKDLKTKLNTSVILVTHDLSSAQKIADRVAIMYAGRIVEIGKTNEVFSSPAHPYTVGLIQAIPKFNSKVETLYTIPGTPPSLINPPFGDAFAQRNPGALKIDYLERPPMYKISDTHFAATWLLDERYKYYHTGENYE